MSLGPRWPQLNASPRGFRRRSGLAESEKGEGQVGVHRRCGTRVRFRPAKELSAQSTPISIDRPTKIAVRKKLVAQLLRRGAAVMLVGCDCFLFIAARMLPTVRSHSSASDH